MIRPNSPKEIDNGLQASYSRQVIQSLNLDFKGASECIDHYVQNQLSRDKITVDPILPDNESIHIQSSIVKHPFKEFTSAKSALSFAHSKGLSLIQDGLKFHIDNPHHYFSKKATQVLHHYYYCIENMREGIVYANRNDTNSRLDTNMTSMPSLLLPYFKLDGEPLVAIDLPR